MILCFSGNGNSRYVARLIGKAMGDVDKMLRVPLIDDPAEMPRIEEGSRVVWVLPVHCWGIPVAVKRFIESLPAEGVFPAGVTHYLVLTCGDETGYAHRQWRSLMAHKGWQTGAAFSVQMPNTYTLLPGFSVDPPLVADAKLAAAPERCRVIAEAIMGGADSEAADDVVVGPMPGLKTRVVYPLFERFDIRPSQFRVADSCVGCGRCVSTCPLGNITLVDGRPQWGRRCTACLGCYNCCPERAIDYGRRSQGKGQYFMQVGLNVKATKTKQ